MTSPLTRAALAGLALAAAVGLARAEQPNAADWPAVLAEAEGQTVYFHAWGGEPRINDYVAWAAREVEDRFGVAVEHVKAADTANVVAKVLAEKTAGRDEGGSVDLVWINGENFASMKAAGLLLGEPWAIELPSYAHVDQAKEVATDFTVPTDGLEAPWGGAQLIFYRDAERVPEPPTSAEALLDYARAHPGRVTYTRPPDFTGTTFLKQLLLELVEDRSVLQRPAEEADADAVLAPLFGYLDALHEVAWRSGRNFPQNYGALRQLVADGAADIGFANNPSDASNAIANSELPPSVRSYVHEGGTIGNVHFLAIPYNASAKAGAMVLADFLMSPEAQARKADPNVWGDPTILDVAALPTEERAAFERIERGPATLAPEELGASLPEPHPSWVAAIEEEWEKRYGSAG